MTRKLVESIALAGLEKYRLSKSAPARYMSRAAVAGAFIFIGTLISCLCAAWFYSDNLPVAKLIGAASFSAALILVVLLGGELFTGCSLVMGISLYEETVSPAALLRVWVMSYVGNFIGILILSLLLAGSGASRDLLSAYLVICVPAKLTAPWYDCCSKGYFATSLSAWGSLPASSSRVNAARLWPLCWSSRPLSSAVWSIPSQIWPFSLSMHC